MFVKSIALFCDMEGMDAYQWYSFMARQSKIYVSTAGELGSIGKVLASKHNELSSYPQKAHKIPGIVVPTDNLSLGREGS